MLTASANTRWDNLQVILDSLEARDVCYDLIDGLFAYRDVMNTLTEQDRVGLKLSAPGLTEHLRRQRGLCLSCGLAPAVRPDYRGIRQNVSEEAKTAFVDLSGGPPHWHDTPVWQDLAEDHPPRWCASCWQNGKWKD